MNDFIQLMLMFAGMIIGIYLIASLWICIMSYRDGHKFLWWRD